MQTLLFDVGFLDFDWTDLIDIGLMGFLIYQLYRIVRGSLAFNIFFGILALYLLSLLAEAFDMRLMSGILGQFINIGVLGLLIVFQPEVRRFLLQLGKNSDIRKLDFWRRFNLRSYTASSAQVSDVEELMLGLKNMADQRIGALLVIPRTSRLQFFTNSGIAVQAKITSNLLESIFVKNSPLHDGAIIITDGKIQAARCVLPVSENPAIPGHYGMRHRSALGITEVSDATAIVVSEENGHISIARDGKLQPNISDAELKAALTESFILGG